jgi:WD40 repeat protein
VYALGVILYELLAGRHPIDLAGCGFAEAAVRIAQRRPARLGTVERKLRGDVETIVAKALEKEPDRRYQSPADLADDLRRTARGDPIQARRESIAYTLSRQVARYRSLAAVSMVLMFVSILLAIYVHSEQSLKLRVVNAEAQSMRREQASRQKADGLAAELAIRLSASRISEGRLLSASGAWIDAERPLWDEYLAHPTSLDAHFALRELYLRSGCRTTFSATTREARSLAVSGNGLIAVGDADGMIHLRRSEDGRPAGGVSAGVGALRAACFLGDGETLAAAGAGGARLVTAAGLNRTLTTQPATAVTATRSLLAIGEDVGWISLFTADGEPLLRVHAATSSVRAIGIDASEKNLVSIHNDGSIRLWRIDRDERGVRLSPGPPIAGHTAAGRTIVFSPDGRTIASGGSDQMIRLWRSADGEALTAVRTKNGTSRDIVFDPTGRQLAVAGYWRTQLFDLTPGEPYLAAARGVDGESLMCRFAENGRSLVTLRTAGVCHVWDLQPDGPVVLRGASSAAVESLLVTRSADEGPLMISAQADGAVTVRSCSGQRQWTDVATWSLGFAPRALAFDRTKDELWVGREDGHAVAYGLLNGRIADNLPDLDAPVRTIDLSPDGQTLVVGLGDGRVTFWRRSGSTWNKLAEGQCGTDVRGASISPDGRTLFTTHRPALLRTWSMTDGRILGELTRPTASYHPAFHPGGAFVAAGDWDRAVHLWDPAKIGPAAEPLLTLVGHNQLVSEVAYDDTGSLLASVATDGQWRLWDARPSDNPVDSRRPERECLASYDALTGEAVTLRFLPTEKGRPSVVVGFRDGTVRIWDLAAGDRYLAGNADYQRKLRADAIALGKGAERNTAAPSPP